MTGIYSNLIKDKLFQQRSSLLFSPHYTYLCGLQVAIGVILGLKFGVAGTGSLSKGFADLLLVLICFYVAAFAWSWGPLGWLVPSECFSLEIRSAGQAITVAVNLLFTFIIAQCFLSMLCHFKFGLFFFFAALVLIMTVFIFFFVPETKNVPIEEMNRVWKKHWFWGRFIPDDEQQHHTSPSGESSSSSDQSAP